MTTEQIRAVGGMVHSDGNIFFTNQAKLDAYVEAIALPVEPDQPDSELEISDAVVERMSIILAKISITLNGPEQPLQRHSYHDLAEKVAVLQLEVDLYRHQAALPVEPATKETK